MDPHGSHRAARGGAAAGRARRGGARVREGLPAPPGGRATTTATTPRRCTTRSLGAFELAASRDGAPDGGAGLQPDARRARLRAGRLGAGDQHRGPARSSWTRSAPSCRPAAWASCACCTRSSAPSATPDGGIVRDPAPAAARRRRVGHALRARPASGARGAGRPRGRRALGAGRRAPGGARLPGDARARRRRSSRRRARAPGATTATRWPRSSPSWSGCASDNFIFLGARDYELRDGALRVVAGSGLGLLDDETRSTFAKPVAVEPLDPALRERALGGELLLVSKTNRLSPVHRRARMDYVGIRRVAADGEIVGEARMIGLFTTKAYAEPASETPLLHRKLQQILASEDLIEGSHDYKAAVTLFDSFPKDELFAAPTEDLRGAVVALLGLQAERAACCGRRDADGRTASIIVALPKGGYDAALLERLRGFLRRRFDAGTRRRPRGPRRGRPRARALHRPPRAGRPARALAPRRSRPRSSTLARTWDDRAARRARRAPRRRARPRCWPRAGPGACPSPTRPRSTPTVGGRRRRALRAAVHRRRGLPRRPAQRARRAARASAVHARAQGRAVPGDADARAPRPARGRGAADAAAGRRRRDVAAGLRRARPDRRAARPRGVRRPRRAVHRGGVARRGGVGLAEPPGHHRRPGLAPGRHPARLPQLPPAHRLALHRGLPERRHRGQPAHHRQAHAPLRAALRPGAIEPTRRPRPRCARRSSTTSRPSSSLDHDRILRNQLGLIEATVRTNAYAPGPRARSRSSCARPTSPRSRSRRRCSRSTSTRPRWRASTCAAAGSRAAACAGRTAWTTAPRSTG